MSLKRKIFLAGLQLSAPLLFISQKAFAELDTFDSNTFGGTCDSYEQWIGTVWNWALTILVPLSVLVLSAAGVLYMISGGNPDKIKTAKKMMYGVFSGIAIIILARVFLVNFLGLQGVIWNVNEQCSYLINTPRLI